MQREPQQHITAGKRGTLLKRSDMLLLISIGGGLLGGIILTALTGKTYIGFITSVAIIAASPGLFTMNRVPHQADQMQSEDRLQHLRRAGALALVAVLLFTLSALVLLLTINYPLILTVPGVLAFSRLAQGDLPMQFATLGWLPGSLLLFLSAQALNSNHPVASSSRPRFLWMTGTSAGVTWGISVFVWIAWVSWIHEASNSIQVINGYATYAHFVLILHGIVTPVLLAVWTGLISQNIFRVQRALSLLGIVGMIGIILLFLSSLLLLFNVTGTIVLIAFLAGEFLWLLWLCLFALWLLRSNESMGSTQ